jgi:nitroreductase
MPDALQLLKTRRSIKPIELAAPGPSAAEIETLLTVASRVPDHGKLVPWRFIIFEGEARLAAGEAIVRAFRSKYPDAKPEHAEAERTRLARAPLVIAVVSRAGPHVKIPEWEQVLSAGAAAMSLVLAAHALGYGASWITEWYAYDRGVLDALGLKENERIAGFVHIGRPAQPPEDRPRPPLEEIATHFGRGE